MAKQLVNRSSAFPLAYPTDIANGILLVENVGTVDNIVLASYRALANGTGYATGDIILYRVIGDNPPQYYNGNTIINPNPNDLGPLSTAANVIVTSSNLPTDAATATLQGIQNGLLNDIITTLPTTGTAGTSSTEVLSIQGVNAGTPVAISGSVISNLSTADNTLLNDIKLKLTSVDNKLVTDNPIGAVRVTNTGNNNAVNIQDGGNSITVDGAVDLTGQSATDLSSINTKIPNGLVVTNNRLVVDNTQLVQPISGSVNANTGLLQPLTNAELRAIPPTVQLTNDQLNALLPTPANTNLASETTLVNVLHAVEGNINFNETIWTDDTGVYFARRATQVSGVVTISYYLPDGSIYIPGLHPRPVFTDSTKQLITSYYTTIASRSPDYLTNQQLIRVDVLDTSTSTIVSSIWFNSSTQTYIPAPLLADIQLLSTDDRATAANQVLELTSIGSKTDLVASSDTGSFSIIALLKRGLQAWTTLLQRIPVLGQTTKNLSIPVTIASDQTTIPVSVAGGITIDTSLLAKESGGNLASINNKLPTSLGSKTKAQSLSITSPTEGLDVKVTDGTYNLSLLNLTNSKPIPTAIVDSNGNQITTFGGGVQYTEGDVDSSITGNAILWEDTSNTLTTISATKPLPVNIISGGGSSSILDSSAFTATVSPVTTIAGYLDDVSTSTLTEGQLGATRVTPKRALHVNLRDANGNELSVGGGTQYTDGATQATPTGNQINWNDSGTQRAVSTVKPLPVQQTGPLSLTPILFQANQSLLNPGVFGFTFSPYKYLYVQAVVTNINTSIEVCLEASNDNSNWNILGSNGLTTTITSNGSYSWEYTGTPRYIRFNFLNEVGGTNATINLYITGQ